ncbi:response regulator [Cohnella hashimotonis]|uniref:Response regulator n=1 Tax=Cohnella hashimotonis TaxID=2826895 RepID=A0ABT6TJW7_9BACL|nr:response regulator [Cohnella hashimotonis]MDI4647024.1 response regulator [Cohnella hashimotonis]
MYKLLIVDDEPSIVEGLAQMIASRDLPLKEIRFAYSAVEAQQLMIRSSYDIVLADIRMPRISGLDWIESVKKAGWLCKVIFLTGYSDFEYTKRALQLGVSDYLLKPADDDEVIASLRKAIGELDRRLDEMMSIEKAKQKLQLSNSELKNQIILDYLNHPRSQTGEALQATIRLLDIPFDGERPVDLILMRIDDWGHRFTVNDGSLIRFAVMNMAEELVNHAFAAAAFRMDQRMSGMLLQSAEAPGGENARIAYIMESVQNTIFRLLGVSISIVFRSVDLPWGDLGTYFRLMRDDLDRRQSRGLLIDLADGQEGGQAGGADTGASVLVEQLKSYISGHLSEDLSLDQLSRHFYVNPTYLSRLFKKRTNEVLSLYITKEKMNAARRLLLQDGMKISEAARQVGYNNSNYFAKVFRNTFGMSPQEYKARMFL